MWLLMESRTSISISNSRYVFDISDLAFSKEALTTGSLVRICASVKASITIFGFFTALVVGVTVDGVTVVGVTVVGITVVGFTVVGITIVGFTVVGFTVVGFTVVGVTVVGFTVVGVTVVGFAIVSVVFILLRLPMSLPIFFLN